MAQLAPYFNQQFFGNDGLPLAGGLLYTYSAGTSTPLATYTDSSGGTANTNPIVLDAYGRTSIWLGTSAYKFILQDSSGVSISTVDQFSYINAGSITGPMIAAGAIGSSAIATGGVATSNLADKSVTANKMADNTITAGQVANQTLTATQMANATLTTTQISATAGILASQLANPFGLSLGANKVSFYTFTVSTANASVGAIYSNNSHNFTVLSNLTSGTILICSATGAPTSGSTTLTKVSGTGDASITVSASTSAGSYSWVVPAGCVRGLLIALGGGGGGGAGASASAGSSGAQGGSTSFNGNVIALGGAGGGGGGGGTGGAGGSANFGPSYADFYSGTNGFPSGGNGSYTAQSSPGFSGGTQYSSGTSSGGAGGASTLAAGGNGAVTGSFGPTVGSLGSGGGGGSASNIGGQAGASGAGGVGCKATISLLALTPGATIPIVIGAGGIAGPAPGGGNALSGAVGGDGYLEINY